MCYIGGQSKPHMAMQPVATARGYIDAEEAPPHLRPFGGLERCMYNYAGEDKTLHICSSSAVFISFSRVHKCMW